MNYAGFTSESLNKKDYSKGWRVAILCRDKMYIGKIGELHIDIINKYCLSYNQAITGFINNKGQWIYQFESDLIKKIKHKI